MQKFILLLNKTTHKQIWYQLRESYKKLNYNKYNIILLQSYIVNIGIKTKVNDWTGFYYFA